MLGFLVVTSILIGTLIAFCIEYHKRTKRNLLKDIFNDMRGK